MILDCSWTSYRSQNLYIKLFSNIAFGAVDDKRILFLYNCRQGAIILSQSLFERIVSWVRYSILGMITILYKYNNCLSVMGFRLIMLHIDKTSIRACYKTYFLCPARLIHTLRIRTDSLYVAGVMSIVSLPKES